MLIPSPEVFENFIAVNNTFAIGKGDNRKKKFQRRDHHHASLV